MESWTRGLSEGELLDERQFLPLNPIVPSGRRRRMQLCLDPTLAKSLQKILANFCLSIPRKKTAQFSIEHGLVCVDIPRAVVTFLLNNVLRPPSQIAFARFLCIVLAFHCGTEQREIRRTQGSLPSFRNQAKTLIARGFFDGVMRVDYVVK